MSFHAPEKYRHIIKEYPKEAQTGNNGLFYIPQKKGAPLKVISSDERDWEEAVACGEIEGDTPWRHVSVSLPTRCPTWEEMCRVKYLFWDDTDTVIQYHPPKRDYVNMHPYCLHLWQPVGIDIPAPPKIMVGF